MELKFILEAVLFSAQKPLSPAELRAVLAEAAEAAEVESAKAFKKVKLEELNAALEQLARRGIYIVGNFRSEVVAGWQHVPFAGVVVGAFATIITRLVAGMLAIFATLMVVCDILLNTARTERVG